MEERTEMLRVCVYADTTGLFTEEEILSDNLCELLFPRHLVEEWYNLFSDEYKRKYSFDNWYYEEYTADETDGFYTFCVLSGFYAQRDQITEECRRIWL